MRPIFHRATLAVVITAWVVTSLSSIAAQAKEWTIEKSDKGSVIKVDGQIFTEYLHNSGTKPVLWPLNGPNGVPLTRAYPLVEELPAGEEKDHIHQRSLWFSHGDVNGFDFWAEVEKDKQGTIVHKEYVESNANGDGAHLVVKNDWMAGGKRICQETRRMDFGADEDKRWVDFDIMLSATDGDVRFGDTKEGAFGLRVPGPFSVTAKRGGKIVNSEGQVDDEAWGKRAAWVDYQGPVDKETYGIAIFNHPSSFRFPTWWHVRTYGLFAANPFGEGSFEKDKEGKGAFVLESGQSIHLRYRVLLHKGDAKQAKIAEAYAAYSEAQAK